MFEFLSPLAGLFYPGPMIVIAVLWVCAIALLVMLHRKKSRKLYQALCAAFAVLGALYFLIIVVVNITMPKPPHGYGYDSSTECIVEQMLR